MYITNRLIQGFGVDVLWVSFLTLSLNQLQDLVITFYLFYTTFIADNTSLLLFGQFEDGHP